MSKFISAWKEEAVGLISKRQDLQGMGGVDGGLGSGGSHHPFKLAAINRAVETRAEGDAALL